MKIQNLVLTQFRNIKHTLFSPFETVNIIYGDNAQGKTSVLEAIWLFSGRSSFRNTKTKDLILFERERAELSMEFSTNKRVNCAKLCLSSKNKREYFFNHVPIEKAGEMVNYFVCVLFTPFDLELADGMPNTRRTFLDVAIGQITPQYTAYLDDYHRVVQQRNALLKSAVADGLARLKETISVWDVQLAKLGTILSIYRQDYVTKLSKFTNVLYRGISYEKEVLNIKYDSSVFEQEMPNIQQYQQATVEYYKNRLEQTLEQDIKYGYTSLGIHRDDLLLYINDLPLKQFGSRGQMRSCVLSLKLAEAQLLEKITGEPPIILLDDVMSELDHDRQNYILNHVKNKQVFITCCDVFNTTRLKSGKVIHIHGGEIVEEKLVNTNSKLEWEDI